MADSLEVASSCFFLFEFSSRFHFDSGFFFSPFWLVSNRNAAGTGDQWNME